MWRVTVTELIPLLLLFLMGGIFKIYIFGGFLRLNYDRIVTEGQEMSREGSAKDPDQNRTRLPL